MPRFIGLFHGASILLTGGEIRATSKAKNSKNWPHNCVYNQGARGQRPFSQSITKFILGDRII